jgi:hypothetical protein
VAYIVLERSQAPEVSIMTVSRAFCLCSLLLIACGEGVSSSDADAVERTWTVRTVDTEGDVGWDTAIAIDARGAVHMSYRRAGDLGLRYAVDATSSAVELPDIAGNNSSLAIAREGGAHVSYFDWTNMALRHAYRPRNGSWSTEKVDADGKVGDFSSLAIDSAGGLHVSYFDLDKEDLKYAHKPASGNWHIVTVDSDGQVGANTSLAIDASDGVHISYADLGQQQVKYAYKRAGGEFVLGRAIDSCALQGRTAIAVDGEGKAHVAYWKATSSGGLELEHAHKNGESWRIASVATTGTAIEAFVALAAERTGALHIAYNDPTSADLMYAHRPAGAAWTSPVRIDSDGDVGFYTDMALDPEGGVHVSYYDRTQGALKYAVGKARP